LEDKLEIYAHWSEGSHTVSSPTATIPSPSTPTPSTGMIFAAKQVTSSGIKLSAPTNAGSLTNSVGVSSSVLKSYSPSLSPVPQPSPSPSSSAFKPLGVVLPAERFNLIFCKRLFV
jgi:hypothetical protein